MAGMEDEIERLLLDGRVHRWSRRVASSWPGHTTFVALKGGEVVVGDRYAGEGIERTYACALESLLEGCFHELVAQQLGSRVLEELLAEVRRELGVAAKAEASTKNAREPAVASASGPKPQPAAAATSARPSTPTAATSERPSTPTSVAVSTPATSPTPAPTSRVHVDLTVVACPSVDLPLAVALRGITRTSVHELLGRLRSLPCRVATGVPREQAEGLAARLVELGAEVRLVLSGDS
jgi:hypothetical protein